MIHRLNYRRIHHTVINSEDCSNLPTTEAEAQSTNSQTWSKKNGKNACPYQSNLCHCTAKGKQEPYLPPEHVASQGLLLQQGHWLLFPWPKNCFQLSLHQWVDTLQHGYFYGVALSWKEQWQGAVIKKLATRWPVELSMKKKSGTVCAHWSE